MYRLNCNNLIINNAITNINLNFKNKLYFYLYKKTFLLFVV